MLQAVGITLWRGTTCLFERLSFQAQPGTVLVIRGPNGAGKTTLLRVLCGLTRAEEGEVLWNGRPAVPDCRGMVAYAGHQPALKSDLTVRQNLQFYARISRSTGNWPELIDRLGLGRCADLEVRHLSAGQKRRAGLARLLMSGLPAWLLDEPLTNIDHAGRRLIEAQIAGHVAAGGLAVVVAHDDIRLDGARLETLTLAGT
jgi:heme exporter protein A